MIKKHFQKAQLYGMYVLGLTNDVDNINFLRSLYYDFVPSQSIKEEILTVQQWFKDIILKFGDEDLTQEYEGIYLKFGNIVISYKPINPVSSPQIKILLCNGYNICYLTTDLYSEQAS